LSPHDKNINFIRKNSVGYGLSIYNPSTRKAEEVQGQPGLHSKTLSQKKLNKQKRKINNDSKQIPCNKTAKILLEKRVKQERNACPLIARLTVKE
jgi:hypothetical protein